MLARKCWAYYLKCLGESSLKVFDFDIHVGNDLAKAYSNTLFDNMIIYIYQNFSFNGQC